MITMKNTTKPAADLATDLSALLAKHGSQAVLNMLASACEGLAMLAPDVKAERVAFKAGASISDAAKLVAKFEGASDERLHDGIEMQEETARSLAEEDASATTGEVQS